jgi:tetratricopeptide (TPR) repeat protein
MNQEKTEITENIKELYNKGLEAFKKENFDYAVELFEQVLEYKPDHTKARHYLRISERAKLKRIPYSPLSSFFKKLSSSFITIKAYFLDHRGQLEEAIKQYEKALRVDPNNERALKNLANDLLNLNMTEAAIEVFEEIRDVNLNNVGALKKLGDLYLKKENYTQAQDCFERVLKLKPHDLDAERGLKNLAALGTIKRGGWEEKTTFREKILDKTEAERLEKEEHTVKTKEDINFLIEQTKKQINSLGETVSNLKKLADLQIKADYLNEALETYQKLKEKNPQDSQVQEKILDLRLKIIDQEIKAKEEKINTKVTQDAKEIKEEINKLKKQKNELRLEGLKQRVSQFPNDLKLRYEYGKALYEASQVDRAISQLQLSVNEPTKKTTSLNLLGLAFKQKKMLDLALTQFKKAYNSLSKSDKKVAEEKEILYNLAQTYEEMGQKEQAIEQYKKIYESDINYKDVAKKIEETYQKKNHSKS